jgi:hypothetical protein
MKRLATPTTRFTLVACLLAVAVLSAVAAASPAITRQRIMITSRGANADRFVLVPLTAGAVARDSGSISACCWGNRSTVRDGQSIDIGNPLLTFVGRHGLFAYRAVMEWVDAGNGWAVGTGSWKIVAGSGTGVYRHLEGTGRAAVTLKPGGAVVSFQAEGFVDLRR